MQHITIPTEPNTRLSVLTRSLVHRRAEHVAEGSAEAPFGSGKGADLAASFELFTNFLLATTRASGVAVGILDESGLHCRASAGEAPPLGTAIRADNSISGRCIRSGTSFYCEDTLSTCPNALPARSILLLPIVCGNNTRGLVALFSRQPQAFGPAVTAIARSAAATMAVALNAWIPQLDAQIDAKVLDAEVTEPEGITAAPPNHVLAAPVMNSASAQCETHSASRLGVNGRLHPAKILVGLPCVNCGAYSAASETRCPVCNTVRQS